MRNRKEGKNLYLVRVKISDFDIRKGHGTNFDAIGKFIGKGIFSIVDVADRPGASKRGF